MSLAKSSLTFILFGPLTLSAAAAAEFTPLPSFPDTTETRALAVSDGGNTVVGILHSGSAVKAYRWSPVDPQLTTLGDLPGGASSNYVSAISGDGQVIVGYGQSAQGQEGLVQVGNNPPLGLSDLPGGFFASQATGASHDGIYVTGTGHSAIGREAFRWSQSGGMQGLGFLPNGVASEGRDISASGNTIVGVSETFDMILGEAFRWTPDEGMMGIGDLPGGDAMSRATAISSPGTVIVGQSNSSAGTEAFRWTAGGGMTGLGDLAGGGFSSVAYDVSADGAVVVGAGTTSDANTVAFMWTADEGMMPLSELLASQHGLASELAGWDLIAAHAISSDGGTIVGTGINPDGHLRAWRVSLGDQMFMEGGHSTENVQLGLGDQLRGYGEVSGQVRIGAGATIAAVDGDLILGSELLPDAVRIAGRLDVGRHHVQLRSATAIEVGGSILMDKTEGAADDCCQVSYDRLSLQGVVQFGDLVGQHLELQSGTVLGDSATRPAVISGRITGEGYLDHVEILDEFAPGGDQSVQLELGNVRYRSAVLELDLFDAAGGHDRVGHRGTAEVVGQLQIEVDSQDSYQDPDQRGQLHRFELLSATNLNLQDDASIEVVYDGQVLGSLTGENPIVRRHVGGGLFRAALHDDPSISLSNYLAIAGDADGDGRFGTADLVQVLQRGKYEDGIALNADWTEGDWNLDDDFDSSDLVAALQTGTYELGSPLAATAAVPEPAGATLSLLALVAASAAASGARRVRAGR